MKDRDELDAIVHGIVEKKALIEVALPLLNFDRIPVLFFMQECEEIEEFAAETGLLISESRLPPTTVAGSRMANTSEIWLYPDGSLQEYRKAATWETFESGCTQRHYVGPGRGEDFIGGIEGGDRIQSRTRSRRRMTGFNGVVTTLQGEF